MSRKIELSVKKGIYIAGVVNRLIADKIANHEEIKFLKVYEEASKICNAYRREVQRCYSLYRKVPPADEIRSQFVYDVPLSDVKNLGRVYRVTDACAAIWLNMYYMVSDCVKNRRMSYYEALEYTADYYFITFKTISLTIRKVNNYADSRDFRIKQKKAIQTS